MYTQETKVTASVKRLTICALMTAVAVILDGLFKIPINLFGAYALKLSFGMAPVIFISIRYGPLHGGLCGAIMDFIQVILFPLGAYNPLFTISAFVMGCIPGLFFLNGRPIGKLRMLCSVLAGQTVGAVILNTVFLVISYGLPWEIIIPRAFTQAILIPLYTVAVRLLLTAEARYTGVVGRS